MGSPAPTTLTAALIATLVATAGAFAPSLVLPSLGGSSAGLRSSYHAKAAAGSIGAPFGASSSGRSALAAAQRISSPLKVSASLSGAFDRYFARNIADEAIPSVAMVTPRGVRNITSRGTAFVIDFPGAEGDSSVYLLTAAHVAAPGTRLEVSFVGAADKAGVPQRGSGSPAMIPAEVVSRAGGADVALIKVKKSDVAADAAAAVAAARPLALRADAPRLGELAFSCGFAGGVRGPALTMGIVSATSDAFSEIRARNLPGNSTDEGSADADANGTTAAAAPEGGVAPEAASEKPDAASEDPPRYVVTDAGMAGGMSGGPLIDCEGRVIGLNCLVRPDLRALGNYAVSSSFCIALLDNVQRVLATAAPAAPVALRVMLFNDPVNTRARVAAALADVAKLGTEEIPTPETPSTLMRERRGGQAEAAMMAAHTTGRGLVREFLAGDRKALADGADKEAEALCEALRAADLLVEVQEVFAEA